MKELDIRIRNGGDDAIAAACELAGIAKERLDPGPALQHRDLPEVVERLTERVRALEAAHNGLVEVAKIDTRWMRFAAREEREVKEKGTTISDGMREQPAAGAVTNPMPEATTGSGSATGLRTERVTLEVVYNAGVTSPPRWWNWQWYVAESSHSGISPGESVRVVPTPGPGLTEEEREAISVVTATHESWSNDPSAPRVVHALLARDAAARDGVPTDEEIAHQTTANNLRDTREQLAAANRGIARLTAERDAARSERDDTRLVLDAALARAANAERAYEAESTARAQAVAELEAARAKPTEATQEPVAWGVMGARGIYCAYHERRHAEGSRTYWKNQGEVSLEVVPLYAAPPTPRVVRLPSWIKHSGSTGAQIMAALDAAGYLWEVEE